MKSPTWFRVGLVGLVLGGSAACPARAAVRLAGVFADGMVLQRGKATAVWGTASPGEKVTVELARPVKLHLEGVPPEDAAFGGQGAVVLAGDDGTWRATLGPLAAGGPFVLEVSGTNRIACRDVLVGEVWVCCGGLNMADELRFGAGAAAEVARADLPPVRHFVVARGAAETPQSTCRGRWVTPGARGGGRVSALAQLFARQVQEALKVPVGVIEAAWPGATLETFSGPEALAAVADEPEARRARAVWEARLRDYESALAEHEKKQAAWKAAVEQAKRDRLRPPRAPRPPRDPRPSPERPCGAYNAMIAPLAGFAAAGVVFCHGEANVEGGDDAPYARGPRPYAKLLPAMIRQWRRAWGRDDLPFLLLQLPNCQQKEGGFDGRWARLREAQAAAAALPKTHVAVAIDLSGDGSVRLGDKQEAARRLAAGALAGAYSRQVAASQPAYRSMKIAGAEARVNFGGVGGGLVAKGGDRLVGFALAGEDRRFAWADATIAGDTVVLRSREVARPVAVRYGFADNPTCNLYNRVQLPAAPFRTDDWPFRAPVRTAGILSDHMVLQRGVPVPVWGTAGPGERLTVRLLGQTKAAVADKDGNWMVRLDPLDLLPGHRACELSIGGPNSFTFTDVLIGDVLLGSGQSNMVWPLRAARHAAEDIPKANHPLIRLSSDAVPGYKTRLQSRCIGIGDLTVGGGWVRCTPATAEPFSALLYYCGRELHEQLNVPIGLMCRAWSGSSSGPWVPAEDFRTDPDIQAALKRHAEETYRALLAKYEAAVKAAAEARANGRPVPPVPPAPQEPAAGPDRPGVGTHYEQLLAPAVPYAVRALLWDQGESGTGVVGIDDWTMWQALLRSWRRRWQLGPLPFIFIQKPSGGGWDWQPEPIDLPGRQNPRPALPPKPETGRAGRGGYYRETFQNLAKLPNAAMVTAMDLGAGLHPPTKDLYGRRMAQVVLAKVYGREVAWCGPVYKSHRIAGGEVRIRFDHVGGGLVARHGDRPDRPRGFAIAGSDRAFCWAEAKIESDTVVVWSKAVAEPVAVRYAWSSRPSWANLFNKEGLPALTFRTDDWPAE